MTYYAQVPPGSVIIETFGPGEVVYMHEYSIAYDIYATARKTAQDHHASSVRGVRVEIGQMAMANAEQVQFLFEAIAGEDPLFSGVVLSCDLVPPEAECTCGYKGPEVFVCPVCGSLPHLVRGREIMVKNVEIEVDGE